MHQKGAEDAGHHPSAQTQDPTNSRQLPQPQALVSRTYALWIKPTARCEECGAEVRLRGFWATIGLGVVLSAGGLVLLAGFSTPGAVFGILLGLSGALAAIDYASYHVLRWEAANELAPLDETPLLPPE